MLSHMKRAVTRSVRKISLLRATTLSSQQCEASSQSVTPDYINQTQSIDKLPDNDNVNPDFVNRNPRNLELLGIAVKDAGWMMQTPRRMFYHRLHYERSARGIRAKVIHYNGDVILSASSQEWAVMKQLYSSTDVTAAESVGMIIARRCMEAGIESVDFPLAEQTEQNQESERLTAFCNACKENGLSFEEPERVREPRPWDLPDSYPS